QCGAILRHDLRPQARSRESRPHDVRGGWRNLLGLFPAAGTRADLHRRFETHRRIASWTHGLLGRSPDNFPSYVSGLVMTPAMFDSIRQGFGSNIRNYYQHMRRNDIFASHTVTNPQGWRPVGPADNQRHTPPTLRVIDEDDSGVTINGLKM